MFICGVSLVFVGMVGMGVTLFSHDFTDDAEME